MNRFTLKVALRYLISKKSHSAVNFITIISVCGVTITTIALVCVLSVFNGFSSLVESKLSLFDPEIKIYPSTGKTISNVDSLISELKVIPGIKLFSPVIEDHALAIFNDKQMPVFIKGVTENYDSLASIRTLIKSDGTYLLKDELSDYAILSVGVAINLQAHPGFYSQLRLYSPRRKGRINMSNPMTAFRADSLFVSGVYQVDQAEYDSDMIIIPFTTAQHLLDYTTEASAIELKLDTNANTKELLSQLNSTLGSKYVAKNRLMQQETSFRLINIEKWITFLLLGFILIIATFNIISTLSVLILEKDASINTLQNLGATKKQIANIFISEGWFISIFGAISGIIIGVALCLSQQYFGLIKLSGKTSVMIVDTYPVVVEITDIAIILALVSLIGIITSFATSVIIRHRLGKF